MKIEVRTKMIPQQYNVYIADDGTEFSSYTDCENHEEGKKKIEVEGVVWYDRNGNVLPLTLASWGKVAAIHFENYKVDYKLYNILEKSEYDMSDNERVKFFAYSNSSTGHNEPYLILYDEDNEVWENVTEKYKFFKKWFDKI